MTTFLWTYTVFERGDYYYKFVPSSIDNRTFEEAREICHEEEDADLLTVEDSQEMTWIDQKIKNMNYRIRNLGKLVDIQLDSTIIDIVLSNVYIRTKTIVTVP